MVIVITHAHTHAHAHTYTHTYAHTLALTLRGSRKCLTQKEQHNSREMFHSEITCNRIYFGRGTKRLETLIELEFVKSSLSNLASYLN